MKTVSAQYKQGMAALLREQSYVRIIFDNVDVAAATDGTWTSNGAMPYSEVTTLDYRYAYAADATATLELNRWMLDGGSVILTDGVQDGFVSSYMSGQNGAFGNTEQGVVGQSMTFDAAGEYPVTSLSINTDNSVTLIFGERPVMTRTFSSPHDLTGLTLTFDSRREEYPREVTVDFRANGASVAEVTAHPTAPKCIIEQTAAQVDEITITFAEMLPYRRPRVQATVYGVEQVFENDVIVETKESTDVDPLSRRLPQERLSFTIYDYDRKYDPDNPTGVYAYIDVAAPVQIQYGYTLPDGTVEWLKSDRYLLDGKPTVKNAQATFTATGLIETLNGTYYKDTVNMDPVKSYYSMAVDVLRDANLPPAEDGTDPWDIDTSLEDMWTATTLPIDTHKHCLQLIAHACRCRLFTDDDNIIHIKPFGVTVKGIYNGTYSDNGHTYYSSWDTVDSGSDSPLTYATLELNRWMLDVNSPQVVISKDDYVARGYVSDKISDETGAFSTSRSFTRTFDVSHDLPVVGVRFGDVLGDFPRLAVARYYAGNTLVTSVTKNLTAAEAYFAAPAAFNCTRVVIAMNRTLPYTRARVDKVWYRETDFSLDFTTIAEKSQTISKIDKLRDVTVNQMIVVPEVPEQVVQIYKGTTAATTLHVEYGGLYENVQIAVSGGTLTSSSIYGRAADMVLSSGTKTVTVTGTRVQETAVVVSYPVATDGEQDKEENPLIDSESSALALAEHVSSYLQLRNTYDVEYRGNPELEVGDIIGLQTRYTPQMDAIILVDEITFNGALHGRMKVKGLI